MTKWIFLLILWAMNNLIFAQNLENVHVLFFYDVRSNGPHLSDNVCQKLYGIPLRYIIENDKPHYLPHPYLQLKSYQRMSSLVINDEYKLYSGIQMLSYNTNPQQILTQHLNFNHLIKHRMVEGAFYVSGFCKGYFLGVKEYKNRH